MKSKTQKKFKTKIEEKVASDQSHAQSMVKVKEKKLKKNENLSSNFPWNCSEANQRKHKQIFPFYSFFSLVILYLRIEIRVKNNINELHSKVFF